MFNMPRTLAAASLSLALALMGVAVTPAPARADSEDAAAVIAGIIALYAIGRAIENRNERPQVTQPQNRPNPGYGNQHSGWNDNRYERPRDVRVIPSGCYREFSTRQGLARGYVMRCMQNNVRNPGLLPPDCIMRVETNHGARNLYDGRCLAWNGWEQEARYRH